MNNDINYIREKVQSISYDVGKMTDALTALGMVKILAFQGSVNDLATQLDRVRTFNDNSHYLQQDLQQFNQLLIPISALASEKIKNDQIDARVKEAEFKLKLAQVKATDQVAWKNYENMTETPWYEKACYFTGGLGLGLLFGFHAKL